MVDFTAVVAVHTAAAVAVIANPVNNQNFVSSQWIVKFKNGEKPYAASETEPRQISLG